MKLKTIFDIEVSVPGHPLTVSIQRTLVIGHNNASFVILQELLVPDYVLSSNEVLVGQLDPDAK